MKKCGAITLHEIGNHNLGFLHWSSRGEELKSGHYFIKDKGLLMFKLLPLLFVLFIGASCSSSPKKSDDNDSEGQFSTPEGAQLIYYKEGKLIVIKSCDNAKGLDINNPKVARAKCIGKENRVTAELFRQILKKVIAEKALEQAKKQVTAAPGGAPPVPGAPSAPAKSAQEKIEDARMENELEFIEAYNKDDNALKDLKSTQVKGLFKQKLKTAFDNTVDSVVNSSANAGTDPDGVLYAVLKSLDPNNKRPCGLTGSVGVRIKDCASTTNAEINGWRLVVRDKSGREIWQDQKIKLVWGEVLSESYDHIEAVGQCSRDRAENGGLAASSFRLPDIEEFQRVASGESPVVIGDLKLWSSNSEGAEVWIFNGVTGKKELISRTTITKDKNSGASFSAAVKLNARCVGKFD